jgi:asparagine synthase (glutamine-hydrolysing)
VWRTKFEFARGAGSIDMMVARAEELISDEMFSRERRTVEGLTLRSKEELYYYRLFKEHFPRPDLTGIVGRWDPLEKEPW